MTRMRGPMTVECDTSQAVPWRGQQRCMPRPGRMLPKIWRRKKLSVGRGAAGSVIGMSTFLRRKAVAEIGGADEAMSDGHKERIFIYRSRRASVFWGGEIGGGIGDDAHLRAEDVVIVEGSFVDGVDAGEFHECQGLLRS